MSDKVHKNYHNEFRKLLCKKSIRVKDLLKLLETDILNQVYEYSRLDFTVNDAINTNEKQTFLKLIEK
jgi:hypothetical protein